jgi:3-phosphoglycerate kinase
MSYHFKTIDEIGEIRDKRILVRVDFNVSEDGFVKDDFKIQKALPTINFLRQKGAIIFLLSHIGSQKNETMINVAEYSKKFFPVFFAESIQVAQSFKPKSGDVVILENVRLLGEGETKNDLDFAKSLASLADIYVNEAFSASHREHASVVSLPHILPSYAGFLFAEEVKNLSVAFDAPRPYVAICGGVKASTKIPLINEFLAKADVVFVGGALANDFFRARGENIGHSVDSEELISSETLLNKKLILPEDVKVLSGSGEVVIRNHDEINEEDTVVDIGPETIKSVTTIIQNAKFILWNGPLGWSNKGFIDGTKAIANIVGQSGAYSILGGGDSVDVLDDYNLLNNFSFVSTGGGAMMDFLVKGTLPGLTALQES